MSPRVTIGVPVFNEEEHLEETLESAVNQEHRDLEIIVADNASTDRSADIIRAFCARDPRVRGIFHSANTGPLGNYWALLNAATTKYFVFLGGHDIFLPGYLREAVKFLEREPAYIMAYPQSQLLPGRHRILNYHDSDIDSQGLDAPHRMLKVAAGLGWCTCYHGVFRTEMLRQLPVRTIQGSDHLLLYAAAYHGHIRFLPMLGILRREDRDETEEMIDARRRRTGLYKDTGTRLYTPLAMTAAAHLKFVLQGSRLSWLDRAGLLAATARIFKTRFHTDYTSIAVALTTRWREL